MPRKSTSEDKKLPRKSTKKIASVKPRGRMTRKGYNDVPNDNPNGKEDFENLLNEILKPLK